MSVVELEEQDGVAVITLNRPERLNALSHFLLAELLSTLRAVGDSSARAVVLTGAGRCFCAGLDLDLGLADPTIEDPTEAIQAGVALGASVTWALRSIPQPVIAAVRSHAVGAGFAFAAAADVRFVSADVRFSAPFVDLGMTAGDFGLSWLLPRLMGAGRANHLFYSGGSLDADQAVAAGLAPHVSEDPVAEAMTYAAALAQRPPYGVQMSKQLLNGSASSSLRNHLDSEAKAQTIGLLTSAASAAMAAARSSRPPTSSERTAAQGAAE